MGKAKKPSVKIISASEKVYRQKSIPIEPSRLSAAGVQGACVTL
jgi:hypothetical protein